MIYSMGVGSGTSFSYIVDVINRYNIKRVIDIRDNLGDEKIKELTMRYSTYSIEYISAGSFMGKSAKDSYRSLGIERLAAKYAGDFNVLIIGETIDYKKSYRHNSILVPLLKDHGVISNHIYNIQLIAVQKETSTQEKLFPD